MKKILQRSLAVFAVVFASFFALGALAQDLIPVQPDAPPDIGQLLAMALGVITTWKGAGVIAGVVALTQFLTNLTKLPLLDKFFGKLWWLRPTLALVFGLVSATLGSVLTGASWPSAILGGILAGLTSIAFHELVQQVKAKTKTERVLGAAVVAVMASGDTAKVEAMKLALAEANKLTDEKARLAALAAWANANG